MGLDGVVVSYLLWDLFKSLEVVVGSNPARGRESVSFCQDPVHIFAWSFFGQIDPADLLPLCGVHVDLLPASPARALLGARASK